MDTQKQILSALSKTGQGGMQQCSWINAEASTTALGEPLRKSNPANAIHSKIRTEGEILVQKYCCSTSGIIWGSACGFIIRWRQCFLLHASHTSGQEAGFSAWGCMPTDPHDSPGAVLAESRTGCCPLPPSVASARISQDAAVHLAWPPLWMPHLNYRGSTDLQWVWCWLLLPDSHWKQDCSV